MLTLAVLLVAGLVVGATARAALAGRAVPAPVALGLGAGTFLLVHLAVPGDRALLVVVLGTILTTAAVSLLAEAAGMQTGDRR